MNYSIFRFTLNMHSHRSQASISVFRGDTAVRLIFTITDGGNPYYIEDGCTAILSGTKADGTKFSDRCIIENNTTVAYDFAKETTTCAGIVNCEITLYGADGEAITAPKFVIVVDEKEATLADFSEEISFIMESESARNSAEAERAEAENQRIANEEARETARSEMQNAETLRKNQEASRISAESSRESYESTREADESTRIASEEQREANEAERIANEEQREAFAETTRQIIDRLTPALDSNYDSIKLLEKANQGHTLDFVVDDAEPTVCNPGIGDYQYKEIPINALPYVVIDRAYGKSEEYTYIDYPSETGITGRQLKSITAYGRNLLNSNVCNFANWTKINARKFAFQFSTTTCPLSGKYTIQAKSNGYGKMYLEKNTSGTTWKLATTQFCTDAEGNTCSGEMFNNTPKNVPLTFEHKSSDKWRLCIEADEPEYAFSNFSDIQIEWGAKATEYAEFYRETFDMPTKWYCYGINDEIRDYIDFENKQLVRNCKLLTYITEENARAEYGDVPMIVSAPSKRVLVPRQTPYITDISNELSKWDSFIANCCEKQARILKFNAMHYVYARVSYNGLYTDIREGEPRELTDEDAGMPITIVYQVKL